MAGYRSRLWPMRDEIMAFYAAGHNGRQTAERFGVATPTVLTFLERHCGVTPRPCRAQNGEPLQWLLAQAGKYSREHCLDWPFRQDKNGYGLVQYRRKVQMAHRVAYKVHTGPIPRGKDILHSCDRPPCINPLHLFPGTQADNNYDRDDKGRGLAKLTAEQVLHMRHLYNSGTGSKELAGLFGVSPSTVWGAVTRRTWHRIP